MFQRRSIFLFKTYKNVFQQRNLSADVGFIGVGNMGAPMANNLIKKGRKVKVYDIAEAAVQKVSGAHVCSTPKEAATDVDLVVTSLPLGSIVKQVLTGENGILKGINKNSILIETSTLNPVVAQEFHKITEDAGIPFLDTPTSGGVAGAVAGTLTFMVGGKQEILKKVEPYLLEMGARIIYCGGPGAGQIAKLCNNLIVAVSMIGVAEGMNMGAKMGLDLKTLANVINTSTGRCYSSDTYNPVPGIMPNVPSSNNYEGGEPARNMAKDLSLVQELAVSCDAPIILGSAAHQVYRVLSAHGYGSKDYSVVYQFLQGLCTTNDLDIMFLHMNNARYIRELDFARFHFYDSTGIYKAIKKAKGNVVQSANCIRYRKPIPLFTTFKVTTKLIYWDDKSLYLEQQFISLKDGFIRAIAYSKQTAINANVPEILAKLIDKEESYRPNPLEELKHFTGLLDTSSERLRKKDE